MRMCVNDNRAALGKLALGSVAATLLLLAAPFSWASQECQEYNRITQDQVEIGRMGIKRKDYATPAELACPGVDAGPRWSSEPTGHFNWCLAVTPAQRAAETEARRGALKYCTAKRGELIWPHWDTASCALKGNVSCFYSPNDEGKQRCNADGKIIMGAVQKIRADPTLLHDHVRDNSLYNSKYYHNYSHWTGFRCELRVRLSGTASFKEYKLEGSTRSLDSLAPRPGYMR